MRLSVTLGVSLLLPLVLAAGISAEPARFDNHRIYNVAVETPAQLYAMQEESQEDTFLFAYEPIRVGQQLKVTVAPEAVPYFEDLVQRYDMKTQLLVDDVQRLINREMVKSRAEGFAFDEFHRLDEMYAWLDTLPLTYPGLVTRIRGGESVEGRYMEGVKITRNDDHPIIFIEANIHGNEWITSSGTLWMINNLLTSTDPEVQAAVDNYTWVILPMVNPDGYEYSHTHYRMWRKNRARHGLLCFGTDLNRNWDIEWRSDGNSSSDPCNTNYIGKAPFTEIEAITLRDFIVSLKDKLYLYLTFHSAINQIMVPYAYKGEEPADYPNLHQILVEAHRRLLNTHGMDYQYGTLYNTLYAAHGITLDWVYEVLGVKLVFTFEFRDSTSDGEFYLFIPPPSEIIPNAEEVFNSVLGIISKAEELGYRDGW